MVHEVRHLHMLIARLGESLKGSDQNAMLEAFTELDLAIRTHIKDEEGPGGWFREMELQQKGKYTSMIHALCIQHKEILTLLTQVTQSIHTDIELSKEKLEKLFRLLQEHEGSETKLLHETACH